MTTRRRGRVTVVNGVRYRSGFEASVARSLAANGVSFEYEAEKIPYEQPRIYVPDFIVMTKKGTKFYVEVKGYFPTDDRTKVLSVIESNPDLDIRLVLQRPETKIRRGSRTTYGSWCSMQGIRWAAGTVPSKWLEE